MCQMALITNQLPSSAAHRHRLHLPHYPLPASLSLRTFQLFNVKNSLWSTPTPVADTVPSPRLLLLLPNSSSWQHFSRVGLAKTATGAGALWLLGWFLFTLRVMQRSADFTSSSTHTHTHRCAQSNCMCVCCFFSFFFFTVIFCRYFVIYLFFVSLIYFMHSRRTRAQ